MRPTAGNHDRLWFPGPGFKLPDAASVTVNVEPYRGADDSDAHHVSTTRTRITCSRLGRTSRVVDSDAHHVSATRTRITHHVSATRTRITCRRLGRTSRVVDSVANAQ